MILPLLGLPKSRSDDIFVALDVNRGTPFLRYWVFGVRFWELTPFESPLLGLPKSRSDDIFVALDVNRGCLEPTPFLSLNYLILTYLIICTYQFLSFNLPFNFYLLPLNFYLLLFRFSLFSLILPHFRLCNSLYGKVLRKCTIFVPKKIRVFFGGSLTLRK